MRKVYMALLAAVVYCLVVPADVKAQYPASSYDFTAVSGTFTEITGGTAISDIEVDEGVSDPLPIGFSFEYCGLSYTTFVVSSNGWLSFDYAGSSAQLSNTLSNLGNIAPALFPLWDDLSGSVGDASYRTSGTAPNRVLTVEFKEWRWNWSSSYPPNSSFQIKLYETTNVIEFIYRRETAAGNPSSASIGIADNQSPLTYLVLDDTGSTPSVSSTTFTTSIDERPPSGQIYRFAPPPPCSNVTGLPTSALTEVSDTAICVASNVLLNYVPNTPLPLATGFSYLWQRAPTLTGPWSDIGTSTRPEFSTVSGAVGEDSYFRVILVCEGNTYLDTASPTPLVVVENPQVTGATGGSRCGPGTVDLSATASAGSMLSWYAAPVGGTALGTGTTFTTPYIPATTDFYVAANNGATAVSDWIGSGTSYTSSQPNPLYATYEGNKIQVLITAAEMQAAGFGAGTINAAALRVGSVSPSTSSNPSIADTIYNFNISIGHTTVTDLTTTFESGLTNVYSVATYVPDSNAVNNYPFNTPFYWNGTSNLVVEFCFSNPNWGGTKEVEYTTGLGFNASHYQHSDGNMNQCGAPTGSTNSTSTSRPNILLDMTVGCEGPREAVTATVTPGPNLSIDHDTLVCNDAVTQLRVSSPLSDFSSYVWDDPNGVLYTDAAGSTAYTGGNASTVYFRSTIPELHLISLAATNGTLPTDCAAADTIGIWVQPGNVEIASTPDTICVSGPAELSLVPDSGYAAGSIQWQESVNGTAYSNLAGATTPFFTTPTLSTEHYYKALIRGQNGVCEEATKHLVIADPQVLSKTDSFNCGPGTVTLRGVAGTNSGLYWYQAPEGGAPLGTGPSFTTPYLQATDTFYVGAGTGGGGAGSDSLAALSTGGNSCGGGVMFDLIPNSSMQIDSFLAVAAGSGSSVNVYFKTGTYAGNGTNSAAWTLHATVNVNYTSGDFIIALPTPIELTANNVYGIYLNYNSTYTDGTGTNQSFSNADLTLEAGYGLCGAFSSVNNPRVFNGTVYYSSGGCESPREPVIAFIYPDPAVDLGNDINACVDSGTVVVLDAGAQPYEPVFRWDDNSSSQIRAVNTSGEYFVSVTNQWGCVSSDTVSITLRENPEVDLGNDTSVCEEAVITLDAGPDGAEYFWNNGRSEQVITVDEPGTFIVLVTNELNCTTSDTIEIAMEGELPTVQGIDITNNGANTFTFDAINPQHVIGYQWDFGDGSAPSYQQSPTHTYPAGEGDYVVTLTLSSSCGFISDSTSAHVVSIGNLDLGKEELLIYPNPTQERATIKNNSSFPMEQIEVVNLLGQRVYSKMADGANQHSLELHRLASGIYQVQIYTSGGRVNRKLEILR